MLHKIIITIIVSILLFVFSNYNDEDKKEEDINQGFNQEEQNNEQEELKVEEQTPQENEEEQVELVEQTQIILNCIATQVNIRKLPSTTSKILGTIDKEECVLFLEEKNGWCKTYYMGDVAYVSSKYVEKIECKFLLLEDVEKVIEEGFKLLGMPYVYGAQRYMYSSGKINPNFKYNEYDCSSLMQYIFYTGANKKLDVTTRLQVKQGIKVDKDNLQRGDLLFFTNSSRYYNKGIERIGHVALYLGDNYILHTASDYATVEKISKTRWNYFIEARRI